MSLRPILTGFRQNGGIVGVNVSSVFGRNGDVIALAGDYDANQITRAVGVMYLQSNISQTVITSTNTPVKVAGTFTAGELDRFTFNANGTITYDDTPTVRAFVIASMNIDPLSAVQDVQLSMFIAKNGSVLPNTEGRVQADTNDEKRATIMDVLALDHGDTLELFIENKTTTANIVVDSGQFVVFVI